jgi:hypothetical protein
VFGGVAFEGQSVGKPPYCEPLTMASSAYFATLPGAVWCEAGRPFSVAFLATCSFAAMGYGWYSDNAEHATMQHRNSGWLAYWAIYDDDVRPPLR